MLAQCSQCQTEVTKLRAKERFAKEGMKYLIEFKLQFLLCVHKTIDIVSKISAIAAAETTDSKSTEEKRQVYISLAFACSYVAFF